MNRRGFLAAVLTVPLVPMVDASAKAADVRTDRSYRRRGVTQGGKLGPIRVINVAI